ncbi:hypothetical protein BDV06DRAFT_224586 [Aspergillus oleicola]
MLLQELIRISRPTKYFSKIPPTHSSTARPFLKDTPVPTPRDEVNVPEIPDDGATLLLRIIVPGKLSTKPNTAGGITGSNAGSGQTKLITGIGTTSYTGTKPITQASNICKKVLGGDCSTDPRMPTEYTWTDMRHWGADRRTRTGYVDWNPRPEIMGPEKMKQGFYSSLNSFARRIFEDLKKDENDPAWKHFDNFQFLIFKITDDQKTVALEHSSPNSGYELFLQNLCSATDRSGKPAPRYAVYDVEYSLGEDGRRCQMVFISWVPEHTSTKLCMLYASTKEQFTNALDIKHSIQAETIDEIEWKNILSVASGIRL